MVVITVAIFGFSNTGLFLYKFGAITARVDNLEKSQTEDRATVGDVAQRVSHIEGQLGGEHA